MAKPKKYTFENGVMKLNPEYKIWADAQNGLAPPPAPPTSTGPPVDQPLAIVSSMGDVAEATEQQATSGSEFKLSESTVASMEIMMDEDFTNQFQAPGDGADGSELLDGLTEYFVKYEVPVGLINKLMALQFYQLKFIIDDSGSMNAKTDSFMNEASEHVLRGQPRSSSVAMTRWQEAETRMHNLIDILAFVPTKNIEIRFMNAPNVINLQRAGKTVDQFRAEGHGQLVQAFTTIAVRYKTPTLRVLTQSFQTAAQGPDPCMHYLLTDGVPSDAVVQQVADLISMRQNPEANPVTLISCTNDDEEAGWMKEVEEKAPFCSELDDFHDEKEEVMKDQGLAFPYTKGYWLISQLIAAINPHDLDAIDEGLPFTKDTLDNMLGRVHSPQEYQYYFERNPHASIYMDVYARFLNEKTFARNIVSQADQARRQAGGGYRNGERTSAPPPPASLAAHLAGITAAASGGTGVFNVGGMNSTAPPPAYGGPPPGGPPPPAYGGPPPAY
jgi:hypothetical protein